MGSPPKQPALSRGGQPGRAPITPFAVAVAVVLAVAGLPEALAEPGPWPVGVLLDLGLLAALVWRRRSPIVAFSAIAAIAFSQWVIGPHQRFSTGRFDGYHLVADIALLVAFYTVAAWEPRRRTIAAALVLELALLLATVSWAAGHSGPALFVLLSGTAAAAGASGDNRRTRRAYLGSLEERAATLEVEREQRDQLAAAAERSRIARDMHDVVAHSLSVMISLADGACYTSKSDPSQAVEAMAQVSATGRQALGEMRLLLGVLRDGERTTALQPQPCLADLGALLEQARSTGLQASLLTEGPLAALAPGLQVAVYRMVQEALTNTIKHAVDAEVASVCVRLRSGQLEVDIVDDGRAPASAPPTGHGITGMRERAALYRGSVETGPQPGRGWRVQAHFDVGTREPVA